MLEHVQLLRRNAGRNPVQDSRLHRCIELCLGQVCLAGRGPVDAAERGDERDRDVRQHRSGIRQIDCSGAREEYARRRQVGIAAAARIAVVRKDALRRDRCRAVFEKIEGRARRSLELVAARRLVVLQEQIEDVARARRLRIKAVRES